MGVDLVDWGTDSERHERARNILTIVAASRVPLNMRVIADDLSLPSTTAHQLLTWLVSLGLLNFDPERSVYSAGAHFHEAAQTIDDDLGFLHQVLADMGSLNEATGETVILARLAGDEVVYVGEVEGRGHFSDHRMGQRVSLWRSAIGRALAANLDADKRDLLLRQVSSAELANIGFNSGQALVAHLNLIRARGYATELNERGLELSAVSAPIVDRRGRAIAALGIEGPSSRLPRDQIHALAPALIEATRKSSAFVGGALRPTSSTPRPAAPLSPSIRRLTDTHNLIGECPLFDTRNDRLFWVDMYDPEIFRFDRKSGELASFVQDEMVMALAHAADGILVIAASGIWLADPETLGRRRFLGHPEAEIPFNRFNDAKCDSKNRLWVNTVNFDFARNAGALYRMDAEGEFRKMETDLTVPNGMGWSPDNRTMYLVDSADRLIYAYDFCEESGAVSNRRVLVRTADLISGAPDGLTIDRNGNLWVAVFDGWRICQFSAGGALISELAMPVPRPTSCAIGGMSGDILFVTSARIRLSAATLDVAPHSGAVFEISL